MKLLQDKFKFNLSSSEMETLLTMLERKIAEPMPIYNTGFAPIDNITYNNMTKAGLIEIRIKIRRQYESTHALKFKISLNFFQANAFLAAFKFGKSPVTDSNMLAYKINSETHPKLF